MRPPVACETGLASTPTFSKNPAETPRRKLIYDPVGQVVDGSAQDQTGLVWKQRSLRVGRMGHRNQGEAVSDQAWAKSFPAEPEMPVGS